MDILLSILICTIPEREKDYECLIHELNKQITAYGYQTDVEVLADFSPKGSISIGTKRNKLKDKAKGKYICYFDDDDLPSENYLFEIITAIKSGYDFDIITFDLNYHVNSVFKWKYIVGLSVGEKQIDQLYFIDRIFFHLCPHKKELVKEIFFPDHNFQEDVAYSNELKKVAKVEYRINQSLYNYYFSDSGSAARN